MATKINDYRPFIDGSNLAQFVTDVEADDNANPTNWVPVFDVELPGAQVVNARYGIYCDITWNIPSGNRSAYFRLVVNGTPLAEKRVRQESGDAGDLNDTYIRTFADFSGVAINVELQAVIESGGGATPDLTIEADASTISIECKKNLA